MQAGGRIDAQAGHLQVAGFGFQIGDQDVARIEAAVERVAADGRGGDDLVSRVIRLRDAVRHASHENRVGEGGQMEAVLFARGDGGEHQGALTRHMPQVRGSQVGETHEQSSSVGRGR